MLILTPLSAGAEISASNPDLVVIPPRGVNYCTEKAVVGSLSRKASFGGTLVPDQNVGVYALEDAKVVQTFFGNNDFVEAGDVLAEFEVENNEIALSELALAYDIAVERYDRELKALEKTLADETRTLNTLRATYTRDALRTQELRVERAKENIKFARYNSEYSLSQKCEEIAKLREKSLNFALTAPISGYISDMPYMIAGDKISKRALVAVISDPQKILLSVTSGNLEQLKYGAAVTIVTSVRDLPTFSGRVVSNTVLLDSPEIEGRVLVSIDDMDEFLEAILSRGRPGRFSYTIEIEQPDSGNTLLVPVRAINREGASQYVNILEDGLLKKRYVTTGLSDTVHTQILGGIEEGAEVITG